MLDKTYVRVTHYDDAITHVPPSISEYKHAGNELWFVNNKMDSVTKECPNTAGKDENRKCSRSLFLYNGVWSHVNYMGIEVGGICDRSQPSETLKKRLS